MKAIVSIPSSDEVDRLPSSAGGYNVVAVQGPDSAAASPLLSQMFDSEEDRSGRRI